MKYLSVLKGCEIRISWTPANEIVQTLLGLTPV